MTFQIRYRTLVLGCDFPTLHTYWRLNVQAPDRDIQGFVFCSNEKPPISNFKGFTKTPIKVFPLDKLEKAIYKKRIQKCLFQAQNIPMVFAQTIINRIIATGHCTLEFLPPTDIALRSSKPTILVSSLAPAVGKTQVCRYFCSVLSQKSRRVAIIFPISEILPQKDRSQAFSVDDGLHYEFKQNDSVPQNLFSEDDKWQIQQYIKCGAFRVFATTDIRRAIICAEQHADIIIVDSRNCENSFIKTDYRFCVVSNKTVMNVREMSLWPGLVNFMLSKNIILVSTTERKIPEDQLKYIKKIACDRELFYVQSQFVLDGTSGFELFNRPTLVIEHADSQGMAMTIANSMAADVVNVSPLLAEGLSNSGNAIVVQTERAMSPTRELVEKTDYEMAKVTQAINTSNADFVVLSLQRDLEGIVPGKHVIYTTPEISDTNQILYNWLAKFYTLNVKPPLQEHFAAQVDIIMAMAQASDRELFVSNNDSQNREAFCRIFLSSHIPPGFRVTTGEIIDAASNITGQLDVVVVNDSCPRLTIDSTNSIIAPILADTVLSVIEVKTSLTSDQLKKALSQLRPVKALMPTHSTLTTPDGHVIEDPLEGKIITGVFSFNPGSDIEDKVPEIVALYPGVADFIVLPDAFGYFSVETLKVCGMSVKESEIVNGYVKYTSRGMGLAIIFGILNSLAATRRFSGSNCIRYLSGYWGGQSEAAAKNASDVEKALHSIDKIVTQVASKDQRRVFFQRKGELITAISEINKGIQSGSPKRPPQYVPTAPTHKPKKH
ncbi:hypothetical protein TRFO_09774 [Tritrichomonas foetus]|uniref:DUF6602 domain-containing protein n=1 Tax=Tritrichomonas foetus TaxID=1144522 RepID=A0A1J4JDY4_9EUKA|nr:hypothetical protein TRFO_09774 [Tritrichomonas foetus]|eukprot:OHS96865.1 hypothetical protein TRFO_09774 [Tritrichomonas foetus]